MQETGDLKKTANQVESPELIKEENITPVVVMTCVVGIIIVIASILALAAMCDKI
jgi:hypothetical protein